MVILVVTTALLLATGPASAAGPAAQPASQPSGTSQPDPCDNTGGAWSIASFLLVYATEASEVAYLEVGERLVTETGRFSPPRTIVPLVLQPSRVRDTPKDASRATILPTGEWTLELLEGKPLGLEQPITLRLDDTGRVSGFAGCNRYFTQWVEEDGGVRFGIVGATRMYCPETMETETRFLAALSKVARARRAGSHLELSDVDGRVLLRFAARRG